MDLLQTVRKEGSRGGRANFSWDDVKSDIHRENYLGHSLMAPVGRWQQNRDLSWYARADGSDESQAKAEADARKEEIRKIKEAESDALARALGYDVPDRKAGDNANLTELGDGARGRKKLREAVDQGLDEEGEGGGRGLGYGGYAGGVDGDPGDNEEVMEGTRVPDQEAKKRYTEARDGNRRRREGLVSRDEDKERRSRRSRSDRPHRERDRSRERRPKRSRSRDRQRDTNEHGRRDRDQRKERRGDDPERDRPRRDEQQQRRRDDYTRPRRDEPDRHQDRDYRSRHRRRSRSPDDYRRESRD